jgi:outer membrane lipoprotein carrier protein
MQFRGIRAAAFTTVALVFCAASGAASDPVEVLAGLQTWLDETRDLEAEFRQSLLSGALGAGPAERGRLFVDRPGRMRWNYLDPERKVALVIGDRTWLYLEQDRQLWEGRLDHAESLLPSLLASQGRLGELFETDLVAPPPGGTDRLLRLSLVPRNAGESFERITVAVGPEDFGIRSIEVLDAAGNRMLYEFSEIRRNAGLADGVFEFVPPAGTEIVARP